mmetsp:Transcript_34641/g.55661  ORF Transcript_34641/g.55661 Transcript_34641/m.55661 type:complete len:322 (-) Transcript_34641:818-1783(-)
MDSLTPLTTVSSGGTASLPDIARSLDEPNAEGYFDGRNSTPLANEESRVLYASSPPSDLRGGVSSRLEALMPPAKHPWSPGAHQQSPASSALALTVGRTVDLDGAAAAREVNILSPQQRKIEFKRVALFNFSDPENAPKMYEAKMNLACYLLLLKDALFGDKTYKERKDMAAANLFDLTGYCLVKGKSRGKQAMAAAAAVVLEGGDDVAEPPKKKAKVTGVTAKIIQAEMLEISGEHAHATRRTALLKAHLGKLKQGEEFKEALEVDIEIKALADRMLVLNAKMALVEHKDAERVKNKDKSARQRANKKSKEGSLLTATSQ